MKKTLVLLFTVFNFVIKAQDFQLKDRHLLTYYELISQAENKIIVNDFTDAGNLYKQAFKEFKYPHAKDLQNSMKVALKVNDFKTAYGDYQSLKCLGKEFSKEYIAENFKNPEKYKVKLCKNKINLQLKKKLDSLFEIDQYYRKLSGGNYQAYKNELTKSDSVASTHLLKLIQTEGFPNEYNIGLKMNSNVYYHDFYYIIWHQLASNLYSSQKVNFSNEINKALNLGKIRPDIAGQLLDLNNNTNNYSYFKIFQFIANDGKADCCYTGRDFLAENRTERSVRKISEVNTSRKLIGLSTTEEEVRKNIFFLHNKDYVLSNIAIEGFNFQDPKEAEKLKKLMIKLNDTSY